MKILLSFLLFVSFLFASVDINNAGEAELSSLNGVGAKKASNIIAFRESNGCFNSIDDLVNVKGIGAKTLEKNREDIALGTCKN
jgi:competence protein ComEA